MLHIQRIAATEITFGKTEVMNRIQQIRFSGAVASADTNDPFGKSILFKIVVLELEK